MPDTGKRTVPVAGCGNMGVDIGSHKRAYILERMQYAVVQAYARTHSSRSKVNRFSHPPSTEALFLPAFPRSSFIQISLALKSVPDQEFLLPRRAPAKERNTPEPYSEFQVISITD